MDTSLEKNPGEESYRRKRRRALFLVISIGAAVVAGMTVIVIISYFYINRLYSGYDVIQETQRADSNIVTYRSFQDYLLKYSRDGISVVDETGETLWNGGYEMERPVVDQCGDYVVAADVGGRKLCVYDGKNPGADMEMTLPIGLARVSSGGKVAVLLHDQDSDVVNIYNPYSSGEKLEVEIPTNVTEDGYALDFDLSPDGESLVIAYLIVENGTLENKICFYNFTEVGQEQNTLVAGKSLEDNMVSRIQFVTEDEVAIFHEKGFLLFRQMKKPEQIFEKEFDEPMKSVDCDSQNIMVITGNAGETKNQVLHLFGLGGKEELSQAIGYEYSEVFLAGKEIIFTSQQKCNIIRKNGKEKFAFDFGKTYDYFFPAKKDNQYFYMDETSIQLIQLSG